MDNPDKFKTAIINSHILFPRLCKAAVHSNSGKAVAMPPLPTPGATTQQNTPVDASVPSASGHQTHVLSTSRQTQFMSRVSNNDSSKGVHNLRSSRCSQLGNNKLMRIATSLNSLLPRGPPNTNSKLRAPNVYVSP